MSHSHSHSSQSHDHSHMSSIPRDDSCVEDFELESAPLNNARRDQSLSIELHSSIGKCNDSTNVLPTSSSYSSLPCDGCIPRVLITFPCLAPFLPRLPQEQPSIRMALLLFTFSFVSLFFLYIATFDKCNMGKNLLSMFAGVTSLLAKNDIEYFLDYGTLLGAVRDKHIIPWEFDLDIGVKEAECDKISVLKSQFADAGFELFGRNEVISYKENSVLGYDGYLHMPCVRIYQSQEYYTDIYWYQRVTPQRRKRIQENMKRKLRGEAIIPGNSAQLPDSARTPARPTGPSYDTVDLDSQIIAPYNADSNSDSQDWYCNYEGFTDELPGGCILASDLFPIHSVSFEGGKHGIPANSENRLTGAYNDWRTPRPKGYKILFCLWMPSSYIAIFFFAITFTVSVSLFVLIYGCTIARGVKQRMLAVWWRNHSAANIRLRNGRH